MAVLVHALPKVLKKPSRMPTFSVGTVKVLFIKIYNFCGGSRIIREKYPVLDLRILLKVTSRAGLDNEILWLLPEYSTSAYGFKKYKL